MKHPLLMVSAFILCGSLGLAHAETQTIKVGTLKAAPQLDGSADDWQDIAENTIKLTYIGKPELTKTVAMKAGVYGDEVFFYTTWEDSTEDILHKPSIWDDTKQKYVEGSQREDRFALEFAMKGDYDANWFSGKEFTADMWNWKAARTNPIGITHDKITIISKQPMMESYKATLPDGSNLYINRPTDLGGEPYETKRYFKKQQDLMPKYAPLEKLPEGVDDIKAKGVWKNGRWHLEQRRKLNTSHEDDVRFNLGTPVKGAIAVFDHDGSERHFTSDTLTFAF
ncbi:Ethylbenzene dehydrogenase [Thiothrix caldifontis]|uniref:Ethylbenzene dehydrogenase n=1 Tax=Thiothrix caldifontis TaxID=525918 RepID=A0A1H3VIL0_9GAMM|nr:ethylbenzene dehydrogenase-related protein [Thiothrix caldifontis]SDZ73998.1 Ethylbenzene dehydrogenase [Thiothrix caldifontis]